MEADKLIEQIEKIKNKLWGIEKVILGFIKGLGISILEYGILIYIMTWIWDNYGWEKTALILACGVILFGLKQRTDGAIKDERIKYLETQLKAVNDGRA